MVLNRFWVSIFVGANLLSKLRMLTKPYNVDMKGQVCDETYTLHHACLLLTLTPLRMQKSLGQSSSTQISQRSMKILSCAYTPHSRPPSTLLMLLMMVMTNSDFDSKGVHSIGMVGWISAMHVSVFPGRPSLASMQNGAFTPRLSIPDQMADKEASSQSSPLRRRWKRTSSN